MPNETENLVESIGKKMDAFNKANEARFEAIEKNVGVAELEEKVDKIATDIANQQAEISKFMSDAEIRIPDGEVEKKNKEYSDAFNAYIKKYDEGALKQFRNAAVSTDNTAGGYLVPDDMASNIVTLAKSSCPMRQVAYAETISGGSLSFPAQTSKASAGWVGELDARTETDTPDVGMVRIPLHTAYAYPKASNEFIQDAMVNVEAWLTGAIASRLGEIENTGFTTGNGAGKPKGFLSETTVADASWAWGKLGYVVTGAASTISSADAIISAIGALKDKYKSNAAFMMNRTTLAAIMKLKATVSTAGDQQYQLWTPALVRGERPQLVGYPVVINDDMPALAASSLSIAFGDFKQGYAIPYKPQISVLRDPFTSAGFVKFYAEERVGGGVINFEAIKLIKTSA